MNLRVCALAVVFLLGAVCTVQGGTYHVSSNGTDANSGTSPSSAWRTMAKANGAVVAGDVVIVHGGQYSEGVQPRNSGQPGNPITYQVAPGEHAVLNAAIGIQLGPKHSYIVVDGFEVHASYRMAELVGSSYITIRNSSFYGGRGNYSAFSVDGASYCVIQNNYLDRQDPDGASQTGDEPTGGDGLRLIGTSHHNLIDGNTATRCEHVAFASSFSKDGAYQSYNIWRNNTSYKNHTNFSLQDGVQRCVFENNKGYYPGLVWTGGNGWSLQFTGTNCIIRFNTLYDDTSTVYINRQWPGVVGTMTGSANGSNPSLQYNKVYNNTIYGENDQKEWQKEGWRFDNHRSDLTENDNVLKNNIIAGSPYVQVDDIDVAHSFASMNNRYEGNLLAGANGQPPKVRYESSTEIGIWSLADIKRLKPDQWDASNREGDPLFVNTTGQGPGKDFTLRQGSPAIDAGVHLSTAASAGSGTTLVVADAGYFIDGWGVPGVYGDSIKIEAGPPVGINTIDYGTNTITLNGSRSWTQGARIFYYRSDRFQGNAPDIGAHELGGQVPPPPPTRPSPPLLFSPDNGAGSLNPDVTLRWSPISSALSYQVQVSTDANFATRDFDVVTTDAFFGLSSLKSATTYYWRVNATNAAGTSDWSQVWSLTTIDPGNPPANILSNPKFDNGLNSWWSYSNGQAEFLVASPGFTGDHAGKLHIIATGDNTQIFQYNVPLEPNTKYIFSFAAFSKSGDDVDVSVAKHSPPYTNYGLGAVRFNLDTTWKVFTTEFTTSNFTSPVNDARVLFWFAPYAAAGDEYYIDNVMLTPAVPALPGPLPVAPPRWSTDQPTKVTLRWQQTVEAFSYAVEVALDSGFAVNVVSDTAVVDTQYQLSSLNNLSTYYWHVRSRGAMGLSSFSPVYSFTTVPAVLSTPVLTPQPDTLQPVPFTVAWRRVAGAVHYHLQVATDDKFTAFVLNDSTLADTSCVVGPLQPGARYFLRIRATSPVGSSAFSVPVQFTVRASELTVPVLLPLPGQVDQQPIAITVVWHPSPGATSYHLQLSLDSLFNNLLLNDSTVTDTVRHLGPLQDATTYYFRLRAWNTIGHSPFSTPLVFSTSAGQLSVPSIVSMPGQGINLPLVTSIRWLSVPGAVRYQLQLATDLQFKVIILNDSTFTDTLTHVGPLDYATAYFARVRAMNDRAVSAFSLPYGFSTVPAPPSAPREIVLASLPQTTSATLSWPTTPGATTYHLQVAKDSLFVTLTVNDSTLMDTVRAIASLDPSTRYFARVRAKGTGGVGAFSSTLVFTTAGSGSSSAVPRDYSLEQNYPNPFNPTTAIRYEIPVNVHVRIVLYTTLGQLVKTLVDADQAAGRYEVAFAGGQLASGAYFYVFEAGDYVQTRRLLYLK